MAEPFLSELRIMSFNFPPKGWALCNGQLLPINQNQALFALLGTTYGGNGQTNFALPNLQGRTPIHTGMGHTLGEAGGSEAVTLNISQLPAHTHNLCGTNQDADVSTPVGGQSVLARPANEETRIYHNAANPDATLAPNTIGATGGSQPHTNMQPYLVLNFCIALQGIFPSHN